MLLHGGGALHFVQVPVAAVPDDDVRLHEDVVIGEGRFVDGLRTAVDLLAGLRQLLVLGQPVEGYDHPPGEEHVGQIADLVAAFPERLELRRRLPPEFRLVFVEIQGFVALETAGVERLAQVGGLVGRGHLPSIDRDGYAHFRGPIVFPNRMGVGRYSRPTPLFPSDYFPNAEKWIRSAP